MSGITAAQRQLTLALPQREAMGREDFFVTDCNAAAVAMIDLWPHWPTRFMALSGPAGSGKTHLAQVWQGQSGAQVVRARDLAVENLPNLLSTNALVVERGPDEAVNEVALFHLINLVKERQAFLLLTSRFSVDSWGVTLPDLVTRLKNFAQIAIGAPDDVLLRAVIVKQFIDRQLAADEQIVEYLIPRIPRSLDAVRKLVAEIDQQALTERAEVTRPFVAKLLRHSAAGDLLGEHE